MTRQNNGPIFDHVTISSEAIESAIYEAHKLRGEEIRKFFGKVSRYLTKTFVQDIRSILGPIPTAPK